MSIVHLGMLGVAALGLLCGVAQSQDPAPRRYVVTVHEPKVEAVNLEPPVDPTPRISIQYTGMMGFGLTVDKRVPLCCGDGAIATVFKFDDRLAFPTKTTPARPLPPGPHGKPRHGIYVTGLLRAVDVTQTVELVPGKAPAGAATRALDTVLVRYTFENKDKLPHTVATRVRIDTMCGLNDGALFAAPTTHPGKILDGVELKGKTLPPFVQILERPDLAKPGFVGHFTLDLGPKLVGPDRFVCTQSGANEIGAWDLQVLKANGDSDCGIFWDAREIPPGGKLEMAYAYGKGIASPPGREGRLSLALGGSFEPGKLFSITAMVDEPSPGQTLTLELPEGIERVEGRPSEPLPPPTQGTDSSAVLWKARVQRAGDYTFRVRSSNGITHMRRVIIEPVSDR